MILYVSNMGQYRVHWKEHEQHDDGTTTVSVYDKPFVGFHEAHRFATARLSNRFDPTLGRIATRFLERDIDDPTPSYLDDVEFDFVVWQPNQAHTMEIPEEFENNSNDKIIKSAVNTALMADELYKKSFDVNANQDYEVLAEKCLMAAEAMTDCQRKFIKRISKS